MNAKHQHFYNTSLDLVSKKGFKATTMRDLAEAMNCDVSNIYNYITSKQSFLEKVLFDISDTFHQRIDLIINSHYNPIDQLKQVVRLYVELSTDRPLELSLLTNEWRHLKGERKDKFIRERENFEIKISDLIKKGMKENLIKKLDPKLATHLFLSSLRLLFNRHLDDSKKLNKIELERQINEYIFNGICQ